MSEEGVSIRVSQADYDWLMQNRGAGAVKQKVHELIEYYQYKMLRDADSLFEAGITLKREGK